MNNKGLNQMSWYQRHYQWDKQPLMAPPTPPTIQQIDQSITPDEVSYTHQYAGTHAHHVLGEMGVPACSGCHGLGYVVEPYSDLQALGWSPSWWDSIVGTDYGTDPAFRTAQGAFQTYSKVIKGQVDRTDPWSEELGTALILSAKPYSTSDNTAEYFWDSVKDNFKNWINQAGYESRHIPRLEKVLGVLVGYSDGSIMYEDTQYMYNPMNVVRQIMGAKPKPRPPEKKPFPTKMVMAIAGLSFVTLWALSE